MGAPKKKAAVRRAPSTARAKAEKRQAQDDARHAIKIDGRVYTVDPAGITGLIEKKIMRELQLPLLAWLGTFDPERPSVYFLGCFMWISRLSEGDDAELDDVLAEVGYGSDVEVVEAATPPERQGRPS